MSACAGPKSQLISLELDYDLLLPNKDPQPETKTLDLDVNPVGLTFDSQLFQYGSPAPEAPIRLSSSISWNSRV